MPWPLSRTNTTKSTASGHKFTISNPIPRESEPAHEGHPLQYLLSRPSVRISTPDFYAPDLDKPTSPLQSHPGIQPSSREDPQSPLSPQSCYQSYSAPRPSGLEHLERLRRSVEELWDVNLGSEEGDQEQRITFSGLTANPFRRTRGDVSPEMQKSDGVISPSIYAPNSPVQVESSTRQEAVLNRVIPESSPLPMWRQSAASTYRRESKTKLSLVHYYIVAVLGAIALAALGCGITAFAKVQSLSNQMPLATHSEGYGQVPTSSHSLSSSTTPTGGIEKGASIMRVTSTSYLDTIEPPTTIYTTMTLPKTVLLKPPSHSTTSSTRNSLVLEDREEALVVTPCTSTFHTTDITPRMNTITSTIHLAATNAVENPTSSHSYSSLIIPRLHTNIASRRFHAPFSWARIRRQTFHDPPSQLSPSRIEDMANSGPKEWVEKVVSAASTNAAVATVTAPWPFARPWATPVKSHQQQSVSTTSSQGATSPSSPENPSAPVPPLSTSLPPFPTTNITTPYLSNTSSIQLSVLPPHPRLTPTPSWSTIPMLTYTNLIPNSLYTPSFIQPNAAGTPPLYTNPPHTKPWPWPNDFPWPIPTGYVAPNIVPRAHQTGDLTFFNPGTGACEEPAIQDNEFAVAVSWVLFDLGRDIGGSEFEKDWEGVVVNGSTKKGSVLCNRGVRVWMGDGVNGTDGKEGTVVEQVFRVRDRCTGCRPGDLDIQQEVFKKYWAKEDVGRVGVTWEWVEEGKTKA